MNILLVMPKALAKVSGYDIFPIGIAYVSASLKKAGFTVYTCNLEYRQDSTLEALRDLIERHQIDLVASSGLSRDFYKLKEVIDCIRLIAPEVRIVVGGGIMTSDPGSALTALEADIGVVGEGEATVCELVTALQAGQPLESVPGLAFRNPDGVFTLTGARKEIPDIDNIPFPDYEGFGFSQYMAVTGRKSAFITGSRSCPYSCTFCFHPSGKTYRQRSLDNLFQEIEMLVRDYKPLHLSISDELFSLSKDRVMAFCERMAPLGVPWSVQLRVVDVDREMLQAMRASGCFTLSYGLESADDRILKSMRKHIKVEQIERALRLTREMKMDIQGGFIFGDAQETLETAQNTLAWHAAHQEYGTELNMIQVFPGTPLFQDACQRGIITDKVKFLKDGCPQTNVSRLSQEEFNGLASWIYENNMRAKYVPKEFKVLDLQANRQCKVELRCDHCGGTSSFDLDFLFLQRINCPHCLQRYYLDPFSTAVIRQEEVLRHFLPGEQVALWGAGEICIKLLDHYPALQQDAFSVVDASKSRQGLTVCGKPIHAPEWIERCGIRKVIVATLNRGDEIIETILESHGIVERIYLPDIEITPEGVIPVLRESVLERRGQCAIEGSKTLARTALS